MTDNSFDISTLAVCDTGALHLKNAEGELLYADAERTKPMRIVLYGPGSTVFGVVESRQTARAVKRMQDNDGKLTSPPLEVRTRETAEDLAELTLRFENFGYAPAGEVSPREMFEAFYTDIKMGLFTKQVAKFISDWGNFTGASAAN